MFGDQLWLRAARSSNQMQASECRALKVEWSNAEKSSCSASQLGRKSLNSLECLKIWPYAVRLYKQRSELRTRTLGSAARKRKKVAKRRVVAKNLPPNFAKVLAAFSGFEVAACNTGKLVLHLHTELTTLLSLDHLPGSSGSIRVHPFLFSPTLTHLYILQDASSQAFQGHLPHQDRQED